MTTPRDPTYGLYCLVVIICPRIPNSSSHAVKQRCHEEGFKWHRSSWCVPVRIVNHPSTTSAEGMEIFQNSRTLSGTSPNLLYASIQLHWILKSGIEFPYQVPNRLTIVQTMRPSLSTYQSYHFQPCWLAKRDRCRASHLLIGKLAILRRALGPPPTLRLRKAVCIQRYVRGVHVLATKKTKCCKNEKTSYRMSVAIPFRHHNITKCTTLKDTLVVHWW